MIKASYFEIDPELDLVLERDIDVPRELVWKAWTQPEHVKKWFAPAPWTISECEIDLQPGGIFYTVMQSPEGQAFPNAGCFLEIVPNEKLVFTDALAPGYRPSEQPFFTAIVTLAPTAKGTKYMAVAKHKDPAGRKQHDDMGFHEGWGICLDQLVAVSKNLE
jgi:uncharacterized protein YndB with AHSA1/START domain